MSEKEKPVDDLFSDDNVVDGGNWFKMTKIGDRAIGTLVDKSEPRPNKLKPGTYQKVYTLVQDDGSPILVPGRMAVEQVINGVKTKVAIFSELDRLPLGSYVGVLYAEDKEVGQPQPAKILKAYHKGVMKMDVLDKWNGVVPVEKEFAPV